jgi:hypothetical protein
LFRIRPGQSAIAAARPRSCAGDRSFLRDDPTLRLDYCSNVTGVDWLDRTVKKKVKVKKVVEGVEKEVEETQEEFFPVTSKPFITFTR